MAGHNFSGSLSFRYWLPWWFVFVMTALAFAIWTPPFMYPDEPAHLAGAMETMDPAARESLEGDILTSMSAHRFWERAGVETPSETPQTFYRSPLLRLIPTQFAKPLAYYRVCGTVLRLLNIQDILDALFVLRLFGVLLAALTAFMTGLIVREVFPGSPWQAVAMAALSVPQYAAMAGAVNPATASWVSGAMMILGATVALAARPPSCGLDHGGSRLRTGAGDASRGSGVATRYSDGCAGGAAAFSGESGAGVDLAVGRNGIDDEFFWCFVDPSATGSQYRGPAFGAVLGIADRDLRRVP